MSAAAVLAFIAQYRYAFIFVSAPFLGPTVTLASGVLVRLGALEAIAVFMTLSAAELSADALWYWLGHRWGDRFVNSFGRFVGITPEREERVKRAYHRHHDSIVFISKITAGLGIAPVIFFTAGVSRVPFGRYMLLNVIGQVIWTTALLSLGYFLGHLYIGMSNALERVFFVGSALLLAGAVALIIKHMPNPLNDRS